MHARHEQERALQLYEAAVERGSALGVAAIGYLHYAGMAGLPRCARRATAPPRRSTRAQVNGAGAEEAKLRVMRCRCGLEVLRMR